MFISPLFLSKYLAGYRILVWQFFSFNILKYILASTFFVEKSAFNLIVDSLEVMCPVLSCCF